MQGRIYTGLKVLGDQQGALFICNFFDGTCCQSRLSGISNISSLSVMEKQLLEYMLARIHADTQSCRHVFCTKLCVQSLEFHVDAELRCCNQGLG